MPAQRARPFLHGAFAKHWGETGGTPADKDKEIRVRTGKFKKRAWSARNAATGAFSKAYDETKGLNLAPQVGLEPTTLRLTAVETGGIVIVIERYVLLPAVVS
jgi:hypothetical protein